MVVQLFQNPVSLPSPLAASAHSLSVVSWNILLPNSVDGWWTYKMYCPPLEADQRHVASWDHRKGLIKDRLALMGMYRNGVLFLERKCGRTTFA
jgi:hypothetical protein